MIKIEKDSMNRLMMRIENDHFPAKGLRIRTRLRIELLDELTHYLFMSEYAAVMDEPTIKEAIDMVQSAENI